MDSFQHEHHEFSTSSDRDNTALSSWLLSWQRGRYDDPLEILLIQFYIVVTRSHVQIPRVPPRPSNTNKHLSGPRDDFSQVDHRLGLPVLLRYFLSI